MVDSNINEAKLIADCQRGDRIAQKQLYNLYAGKMMGVCLRYCKDREKAKDLLHDGFLKVYSHIDSFESKGSFEGWVRRIMINTALEYLRKQSDEGYHLEIEEAFSLTNGDYSVLEKLQAEEIIEVIQQLPAVYRIVFNLYVIEGYSHKEIAKEMQLTESSSRVYLTRAKQLLQEKLMAYK
jgi:RNA polymerase sigma factor (sigma-70 family)